MIAGLTAEEVYSQALGWAQKFNPQFAAVLAEDPEYTVRIFGIERGDAQARKDIAKWSDIQTEFGFFFDALFNAQAVSVQELLKTVVVTEAQPLVADILRTYDPSDSREIWFEKLKSAVKPYGYAESPRVYKTNPDNYTGHVGDIAKLLRVCLTGRYNSPDLSQVMRIMGIRQVTERLRRAIG